jgi:Txe/YoeB family toxin of Txe-Axe toxin-antitoxin module
MLLPAVLHPDVVDFLRTELKSNLKTRVWECIEKLRQQQFDGGLRIKKLKGIAKRVWEARITQASRLIFTYNKSRQPDTGELQTYIAVQDICLDHDDVSRRAKARNQTPDAQWLDAEV